MEEIFGNLSAKIEFVELPIKPYSENHLIRDTFSKRTRILKSCSFYKLHAAEEPSVPDFLFIYNLGSTCETLEDDSLVVDVLIDSACGHTASQYMKIPVTKSLEIQNSIFEPIPNSTTAGRVVCFLTASELPEDWRGRKSFAIKATATDLLMKTTRKVHAVFVDLHSTMTN